MLNSESRAESAARIVPVALGSRSYDIVIGSGLIATAGDAVKRLAPTARCAVVTDETVARLHLPALASGFASVGMAIDEIIIPAGEASKSFTHIVQLCDALLDLRLDRGDIVIALGGGVVGDLAGFAASILKRGVRLVQIPTTLLAQVDSSIGGKTGINTRHGKNLIGTFHQPSLVLIDTDVLDTLDLRELRSGYAETAKYGLLGDPTFFDWLETHWAGIFEGDATARLHAIERCCRSKAEIVAEDETERGRRALLNLGHTFGHALESWAGYSARLLHGEAVAIGMVLAFALSAQLKLCPPADAARVRRHLASIGLPVEPRLANRWPDPAALIRHMAQDKKVSGGQLTFILVRGIGQAFVSRDVTKAQLIDLFAAARAA
jgi:3-dehydroquinate synthase